MQNELTRVIGDEESVIRKPNGSHHRQTAKGENERNSQVVEKTRHPTGNQMHTICDYQILLRMKYALLMINHQLVTQKSMLQVDTYTHTCQRNYSCSSISLKNEV